MVSVSLNRQQGKSIHEPVAVIEGVGQTSYSRKSGRSEMDLAFQAILAACADADLDPRDIDGVLTYPFSVSAEDVVSNLGLRRLRYSATITMGGASAVASLGHAAHAVAYGAAEHIVIVRARNGYSGPRVHERPSPLPGQAFRRDLEHPYGWNTPAQYYAMLCQRYMHEHELTREQLGTVAVTASEHAQLNPRAQTNGFRLTMEKYLSGRRISDPYTRYDCSLETDGACAVIVGDKHRVTARPVHATIRDVAEGRPQTPDDLTNRPDFLTIGLDDAAAEVWNRTGLGPGDMDAAMIYDCFTFEVIHQLEAAGFAPQGYGGEFVARGSTRLGGKLPVNTHGGLLAEGHLSGLNHVIEAARQLRGECGQRQVPGCKLIAVTGWGDLGDGALAVLEAKG